MKKLLSISIVLVFFFSCKKNASDPEPNSTIVTGQIAGNTNQYSKSGQILTDNLDKVTVSLDNDPATTTTDAAGNYTLSGVKQGIYTIFFSKPGCTTYQIQQVNFPGNGTLIKNGVLIDSPTYTFSSASIAFADSLGDKYQTSLSFTVNLNPQPSLVRGIIYFGSQDVSSSNFNYYVQFSIPANSSNFSFIKILPFLGEPGSFYAKIYPHSGYSYSYFDYAINSNVALGHGPALPTIKIE